MKSTLALAAASWFISLSATAQNAPDLFRGGPANVAQAQRTIVIDPNTRWVNVTQGETIRFVAGGSEFAWRFDGRGSRSFDLQQAAPAGALQRPVMVHITASTGRP